MMKQLHLRLIMPLMAALLLSACIAGNMGGMPTDDTASQSPTAMAGMDHSGMQMDNSDRPFDLRFIDGMIMHHQGAIEMAKEAQTQATKAEIKALADAIIAAQEAEIAQMQAWRETWYPGAAPTEGLGMDMGTMQVAAGDTLYDLRFIEAMIPHHEGAINMAKEAQTMAEHAELKTMAETIITAQEAEIAQMKEWQTAWSE
jgi:uncharacterized protein (DUF305 family)